jgi:hypothetical protein
LCGPYFSIQCCAESYRNSIKTVKVIDFAKQNKIRSSEFVKSIEAQSVV